jgi:small-conductance mechanosensitive channel
MSEILGILGQLLKRNLFTLAGTPINVRTIIVILIIVGITLLLSKLLQRALARYFKARGVQDEGSISVAARLLHYIVLAIGLGIAVHTIGINLTAVFAAGAIFAIGLGFAMQNIAQNFVSGVILLAERTIKPGDILDVDGRMVRVVKLGARAIVARTLDEEDVIIPNSVLVQAPVKNYTLRDALYRIRRPVGVVYPSDMALVMRTLDKAAREQTWRSQTRDPVVLLNEFGDSSVNFEVSVWIESPWQVRSLSSKLNEAIWWALKEVDVTIAYPQLDVHFDPPVVESLRAMSP